MGWGGGWSFEQEEVPHGGREESGSGTSGESAWRAPGTLVVRQGHTSVVLPVWIEEDCTKWTAGTGRSRTGLGRAKARCCRLPHTSTHTRSLSLRLHFLSNHKCNPPLPHPARLSSTNHHPRQPDRRAPGRCPAGAAGVRRGADAGGAGRGRAVAQAGGGGVEGGKVGGWAGTVGRGADAGGRVGGPGVPRVGQAGAGGCGGWWPRVCVCVRLCGPPVSGSQCRCCRTWLSQHLFVPGPGYSAHVWATAANMAACCWPPLPED